MTKVGFRVTMNRALVGFVTLGALHSRALAIQDPVAARLPTAARQKLDSLTHERARIDASTGAERADVLPLLKAIHDIYVTHGAYLPAIGVLEQVVAMFEAIQGPDGSGTLARVMDLADLYVLARDYPRARAAVERVDSTARRVFGPEFSPSGRLLSLRGSVLLKSGDAAAAVEPLETALAIVSESEGPAAHELTPIHLLLAEAYVRLGHVRRPEALLHYGLGLRSEAQGFQPDKESAFYMAPFRAALGALYTAAGFYDKAEDPLLEALRAYEAKLGGDHPALEPILVHLATLYVAKADARTESAYRARAERLYADNTGFAFVEMAQPFPPFPEIAAASDPDGLYADAAVGDWAEYSKDGELSERLEIVHATPALVVIATSRRDGDRWVPLGEEMVRRDIGLREFHRLDSLTPTTCPFVSGTVECLAWSYSGSYTSQPSTMFFAPGVVPMGGMLHGDMGGYRDSGRSVARLSRFRRGGEVVVVPTLEGFPVMTQAVREIRNETEFMEAAKRGDLRAVEAALDRGMEIDPFNGAPLNWALHEGHVEMVRLLIERGARIGPDDLVRAARNGTVEVARLVLEHGLDVNAVGDDVSTRDLPLFGAAEKGNRAMVEFLLERGADPLAANGAGTTALMGAAKAGDPELVRRFLELGVDVNARGDGLTAMPALLFAAKAGNPETVRLLLDAGADASDVAPDGGTTLYLAAGTGNVEVGELLIAAGVDPNRRLNPIRALGGDGRTALMAAAEAGHVHFVRLLIREGADVNAALGTGWTALKGAERGGHTEVIQILKAAGARR